MRPIVLNQRRCFWSQVELIDLVAFGIGDLGQWFFGGYQTSLPKAQRPICRQNERQSTKDQETIIACAEGLIFMLQCQDIFCLLVMRFLLLLLAVTILVVLCDNV